MKQIQIINAYQAMNALANLDLSPAEHWSIYQLRKTLRPYIEFQEERQEALDEKYKEFTEDGSRLTGEKADEYIKERNEIYNMDVELSFEKPEIRLVKGISFTTAEQLENFINFVQG